MPTFTTINGGGDKENWDQQIAQQYLEDFIVWLLRDLANGEKSYQTTQYFFQFIEHVQQTQVPLGPVIGSAIRDLHGNAFDEEGAQDFEVEQVSLLQAALRVIVESMATDNAARARRSKREDDLNRAITIQVLGQEARSRKHGWSYLENLTKELGGWSPRGRR